MFSPLIYEEMLLIGILTKLMKYDGQTAFVSWGLLGHHIIHIELMKLI